MANFDEMLARKYSILGQEADARSTQANAEAKLASAKALSQPAEAGFLNAQSAHLAAQTGVVPLTAQAQANYYGGMGQHARSAAGLADVQAIGEQQQTTRNSAAGKALLAQYDYFHANNRASAPGLPRLGAPVYDETNPPPNPPVAGPPSANWTPPQAAQPASFDTDGYVGGDNGGSRGSFQDLRPTLPAPSEPSFGSLGGSLMDPLKKSKIQPPSNGFAGGSSNVGSDSYDAYLAGLQTQNPTSTPNVTANMRAKLGGPDTPRPQPVTPPGPVRLGYAGGSSNIGSDSYDAYLAALKAQDPTSPANVTAAMRAKLGGPDAPRPQPVAPKPGYNKGVSKVPGKGPSNIDSVKAKLAPGEAVLNSGAAEHVGRPLIDVLNAIGVHKMAMAGKPPQKGGMPKGKEKAFASGTAKVGRC